MEGIPAVRRRDRRLLYVATAVRSFAFGLTSVLAGPYLQALRLSPLQVGVLFTVALAGGALMSLGVSLWADRFGRRRTLDLLALITAVGGVAFSLSPGYGILLLAALTGALNPAGKDRGAFMAVEQSALPQTGEDAERNWIFARYNLVSTIAGAVGALAAGAAGLLQRGGGLGEVESYRAMFLFYAALALGLLLLYRRLSDYVEPATTLARQSVVRGIRSRRIVGGLSGLFALDAFGGGLVVQSFLSYWFHLRFGLSPETLGVIFFATGILNSASYLAAARLARKIGLLNTMVFTHLPSNLLLIMVGLSPGLWLALAFLLAREALAQMDVPTRQSYMVAVVQPEERTAAVGLTTLSRNLSQSLSPSLGGFLVQIFMSGPLFLSGVLKSVYDVSLFFSFRHTKPPEEIPERSGQAHG